MSKDRDLYEKLANLVHQGLVVYNNGAAGTRTSNVMDLIWPEVKARTTDGAKIASVWLKLQSLTTEVETLIPKENS